MVKKLDIFKYRKIENIPFDFSENINLISGTNGTCKTSILYLVSNSYQKVVKTKVKKDVQDCLNIIQDINTLMNPKIESLTRGDKEYNDPAPNHKGKLFDVTYTDDTTLEFRKHNSQSSDRYSLKPAYKKSSSDKLPEMPIIYLGLSRLISYGEYSDIDVERIKKLLEQKIPDEHLATVEAILNKEIRDLKLQNIKQKLPQNYQQEINEIFNKFTGIQVIENTYHKVANIKHRADFVSDIQGVDSNTISAGEDNLYMIITALVSLKYYFETNQTEDTRPIESILLIDEIDATLHPSYQLKLLKIIRDFSLKYRIQFIGTSHSLSLLEYALEMKDNVIYLLDSGNTVVPFNKDLDIISIKMFLQEQTAMQMNQNSKIPIFTEDAEARMLLKVLLDYYAEAHTDFFPTVVNSVHIVDASLSSEALYNIFSDYILSNNFLRSICILDGDQHSRKSLSNNIIVLPGNKNPEALLLSYLADVFEEKKDYYKDFWDATSMVIKNGYQKSVVRRDILSKHEEIEKEIQRLTENSESTKGKRREEYKELFNEHQYFFSELFKFWVKDPANNNIINSFFKDFRIMFKKTALAHGIRKNIWP
ncbi:ATP-binding protein [Lysinibacillus sp. YS11]|uniref:AAA family ATPase n=1 Tax=Lysinibacillus TaxID=400634 RepID=UPI000CA22A84|nr:MULTISPECIES: AAA family ATPase [Lysinibacillus]AUS87060.1 ATP-binding protein [Lysinibacillus sp. YS11]MED3873260.1 AAA family ATPase [Lysinibacillus capsici]